MELWTEVINDLRSHLSIDEIAERAGVKRSTITELQAGRTKQPRYDAGAKLMALRREYRQNRRAVSRRRATR